MQNLYSPVRIRSSPPLPSCWSGLFALLGLAAVSISPACRDPIDPPPAPGPTDLPRWSSAPHILWAGPSTPVSRPLMVIVDQPGGAVDRLLHDVDVATFLNDRFTPLFLIPEAAPELPWPSVQVLDARGCLWLPPTTPDSPAAFIEAGNQVMRQVAAGDRPQARPDPPRTPGLQLPSRHPLALPCSQP